MPIVSGAPRTHRTPEPGRGGIEALADPVRPELYVEAIFPITGRVEGEVAESKPVVHPDLGLGYGSSGGLRSDLCSQTAGEHQQASTQ